MEELKDLWCVFENDSEGFTALVAVFEKVEDAEDETRYLDTRATRGERYTFAHRYLNDSARPTHEDLTFHLGHLVATPRASVALEILALLTRKDDGDDLYSIHSDEKQGTVTVEKVPVSRTEYVSMSVLGFLRFYFGVEPDVFYEVK